MTDNELICALANALRSMTRPFGAQPADYVQAGRALKEYTKWKNTPVSNATEVKIASLKAQVQLCREGAEAAEEYAKVEAAAKEKAQVQRDNDQWFKGYLNGAFGGILVVVIGYAVACLLNN